MLLRVDHCEHDYTALILRYLFASFVLVSGWQAFTWRSSDVYGALDYAIATESRVGAANERVYTRGVNEPSAVWSFP